MKFIKKVIQAVVEHFNWDGKRPLAAGIRDTSLGLLNALTESLNEMERILERYAAKATANEFVVSDPTQYRATVIATRTHIDLARSYILACSLILTRETRRITDDDWERFRDKQRAAINAADEATDLLRELLSIVIRDAGE